MQEKLKTLDDATLWGVLADVSNALKSCPFSAENARFMLWYGIFKSLEQEINKRLTEGNK